MHAYTHSSPFAPPIAPNSFPTTMNPPDPFGYDFNPPEPADACAYDNAVRGGAHAWTDATGTYAPRQGFGKGNVAYRFPRHVGSRIMTTYGGDVVW
ncbi:hypothetical protein HK102_004340, partial [Quaeritorhiza haematococci]